MSSPYPFIDPVLNPVWLLSRTPYLLTFLQIKLFYQKRWTTISLIRIYTMADHGDTTDTPMTDGNMLDPCRVLEAKCPYQRVVKVS